MNTARMAKISMPYRPEPTPPNTTSPSCIRKVGTRPPMGVKESCMALTAPQEAEVVTAMNKEVSMMPKRASLPSILPPACRWLACWSMPRALNCGTPACSAPVSTTTAQANITVIAAMMAQPWRWSPTIRPNMKHSAAGIRKMARLCRKLVSGVGFSNGCAELALKKPPPLVPSSLIASCEATGPIGSVCFCVLASTITGLPSAPLTALPWASVLGCW